MRPQRAVQLLEKAVQFYISQNIQVAAQLYELVRNPQDEYGKQCFERREEFREALEMAKERLTPLKDSRGLVDGCQLTVKEKSG